MHTVFLVTDALLAQPRGWSIVELAWADLLQENLRESGGVLQTVALPLFFLKRDDGRLLRSAWQPLRDQGAFHRPEDGDALAWAIRQVSAFVRREATRGVENAIWLEQDRGERLRLQKRKGLVERITARHPGPIPEEEP
jgi:hypothetical protein